MITISNLEFTSDINLVSILNVLTKVKMLEICKKLDLYVSPNLKKDETARRVAREILDNPEDVLHGLSKQELQFIDEFVKSGPNHYVTCKMRKTPYKLQNYALVLAYKDMEHQQWKLLMPDCVRESLAPCYQFYLDLAERGVKLPSKKELRMMEVLRFLRGDE